MANRKNQSAETPAADTFKGKPVSALTTNNPKSKSDGGQNAPRPKQ